MKAWHLVQVGDDGRLDQAGYCSCKAVNGGGGGSDYPLAGCASSKCPCMAGHRKCSPICRCQRCANGKEEAKAHAHEEQIREREAAKMNVNTQLEPTACLMSENFSPQPVAGPSPLSPKRPQPTDPPPLDSGGEGNTLQPEISPGKRRRRTKGGQAAMEDHFRLTQVDPHRRLSCGRPDGRDAMMFHMRLSNGQLKPVVPSGESPLDLQELLEQKGVDGTGLLEALRQRSASTPGIFHSSSVPSLRSAAPRSANASPHTPNTPNTIHTTNHTDPSNNPHVPFPEIIDLGTVENPVMVDPNLQQALFEAYPQHPKTDPHDIAAWGTTADPPACYWPTPLEIEGGVMDAILLGTVQPAPGPASNSVQAPTPLLPMPHPSYTTVGGLLSPGSPRSPRSASCSSRPLSPTSTASSRSPVFFPPSFDESMCVLSSSPSPSQQPQSPARSITPVLPWTPPPQGLSTHLPGTNIPVTQRHMPPSPRVRDAAPNANPSRSRPNAPSSPLSMSTPQSPGAALPQIFSAVSLTGGVPIASQEVVKNLIQERRRQRNSISAPSPHHTPIPVKPDPIVNQEVQKPATPAKSEPAPLELNQSDSQELLREILCMADDPQGEFAHFMGPVDEKMVQERHSSKASLDSGDFLRFLLANEPTNDLAEAQIPSTNVCM